MIITEINMRETGHHSESIIKKILHGSKNAFIKRKYLSSKKYYSDFVVTDTSDGLIKSYTITYKEVSALRRFYTGIPQFYPFQEDQEEKDGFREYLFALNRDIVKFLSLKIRALEEPDNPLALYIIPELVSNAVKSNYLIESRIMADSGHRVINMNCMLEVVCNVNRRNPEFIDILMRNYALYHRDIERNIVDALHCHWTKKIKFINEKKHRDSCESSEYGLPSIKNAVKKYYNGRLIYDGYDDSFSDFGAYQFTLKLPRDMTVISDSE